MYTLLIQPPVQLGVRPQLMSTDQSAHRTDYFAAMEHYSSTQIRVTLSETRVTAKLFIDTEHRTVSL